MKFKKSLGQHFLIDGNIKKKIVDLIELSKDDTIVEIGPGDGALTDLIYGKCKKLILIEKDNHLGKKLKSKYLKAEVFIQDFLKWDFNNLKNVKIVGNLPYNVASQIIFKIIQNIKKWQLAVFMVQKEVAERIIAAPKNKDYSILSVIVQSFCKVRKVFDVSPECFIPKPKVISSVVKIIPVNSEINDFHEFFKFTKALFYGRRKKLVNVLKKNPYMTFNENFIDFVKENFSQNVRIEELKIEDIEKLFKEVKKWN